MGAPELRWNGEALRQHLDGLWPGLGLEIVAQTASTNTDLLDRVRSARFMPCLRVAEQQSGGRGRQGRRWHSERGASLTFSLALPLDRTDWSGLSLALGVALADALDPAPAAHRIGLKWPNDLWLLDAAAAGRKLGGILVETSPLGAQRVAVIGVGLNIRTIGPAADVATGYAALDELMADASAPAALARVAAPLVAAVVRFEAQGFAAFRERYAARDLLFGRPVWTTQRDLPDGIARGVAAHGQLIVETPDGVHHHVGSGEVSVRIGAPPAATSC